MGVHAFGGPDNLRRVGVHRARPDVGEVRLRVRSAAVNPVDTLVRSGVLGLAYFNGRPPPFVPGMDAAGVIEDVGRGVVNLDVGDEVMALALPGDAHGGAYTNCLLLPAHRAARLPKGLDLVAASTVPMNALTAAQALDLLSLEAGQSLGITGAAGAVGGYAIQLAKAAGLFVIADASPADAPVVHALGADVVVPRGPDVARRMRAVVRCGVDGVIDAALIGPAIARAVRDGGALAVLRGSGEVLDRGIVAARVGIGQEATRAPDLTRRRLEHLSALVDSGTITPRVATTLPLEAAAEAHRRIERGGVRGRIVLTVA